MAVDDAVMQRSCSRLLVNNYALVKNHKSTVNLEASYTLFNTQIVFKFIFISLRTFETIALNIVNTLVCVDVTLVRWCECVSYEICSITMPCVI